MNRSGKETFILFSFFLFNNFIVGGCNQHYPSVSFPCTVHPAAKKAMLIGIVLSCMNQLSGCFAMLMYTNAIFEEAGSSLSPNASAIIIALTQWGANCVTIMVVEKAGRKVIYAISAFGASLGLTVLGVHSLYRAELADFGFIPIAAFSFFIFIASVGLLPLHYVILIEIMPKKVKRRKGKSQNRFD